MNGIHAQIGGSGTPHDYWLKLWRDHGTGEIWLAPDEWSWLTGHVEELRTEWREKHGDG